MTKEIDSDDLDYVDDTTAILDGEGFTGRVVEDSGPQVAVQYFMRGLAEGPDYVLAYDGMMLSYANCYNGGPWVGPRHEWDGEGNLRLEAVTDSQGNKRVLRHWDEHGRLTLNEEKPPERGMVDSHTGEPRRLPWRQMTPSSEHGDPGVMKFLEAVDFGLLDFDGKESLAIYQGNPYTGEAFVLGAEGRFEARTFMEGVEDGPFTVWAPSNKLIVLGVLRHPYGPVGPWHEWGEDGRLLRETIYDALGNKIIVREFDEAGNMAHEEKTPPTRLMRDPETGEERPAPWL